MGRKAGDISTLKKIAGAAGVSITVVSDVLNRKAVARRVAPATEARVLAAAKKMGYAPNIHARALVQRRTFLAGLVASSIHTSFFGGIVAGFVEKMEDAGLRVLLSYSRDSKERADEAFEEMVRRGAEGVAFVGGVPDFRSRPLVPVAATHLGKIRRGISTVTVDHAMGSRLAAEHLLQLGRRNVALIGYDVDERLARAGKILEAAGAAIKHCSPGELPALVRNGVNGAFASTDFQAVEAMGELLCSGLSVPRDCAMIGYDDLILAKVVRPALTTIRQPKESYGQTLAELLLEGLNGKKPRAVRLSPELVVRGSSMHDS